MYHIDEPTGGGSGGGSGAAATATNVSMPSHSILTVAGFAAGVVAGTGLEVVNGGIRAVAAGPYVVALNVVMNTTTAAFGLQVYLQWRDAAGTIMPDAYSEITVVPADTAEAGTDTFIIGVTKLLDVPEGGIIYPRLRHFTGVTLQVNAARLVAWSV